MIIGVALCSTALGTLLPILRDAGESKSPIGIAVTALGAVGEFGPPVAISLFFSGRQLGTATAADDGGSRHGADLTRVVG